MSDNLQKYRFLQKVLPNPSKKHLVLLTGARQLEKLTCKKLYRLRFIGLIA
jgi:hypothetical protein